MTLTKKAFTAIKGNGELYGKIADILQVSPITLQAKILRNDPAFTQIAVINLIKQYTGLTESEILAEATEVA